MNDCTVFVGLDYHQDSVQVCVLDRPGRVLRNGVYENDASVIGTVVENYGTAVHVAIESCTGAADCIMASPLYKGGLRGRAR